jgi:hypothetical protein
LIFGFDDTDDEQWLAELKQLDTLHFFEKQGESFVHLLNWEKHQNQRPDRRQPSVYQVCDKCPSLVRQMPAEVSKLSKDKEAREVSNKDYSLSEKYKEVLAGKGSIGKQI